MSPISVASGVAVRGTPKGGERGVQGVSPWEYIKEKERGRE